MRKQYHFRVSEQGLLVWDVLRLVALSKELPRMRVPLSSFRELDEAYWFDLGDQQPTCRAVVEHATLINQADLAFPVILSSDGRVMDGMHRVAKALMLGHADIETVRFERDPEPDFFNRSADELPY